MKAIKLKYMFIILLLVSMILSTSCVSGPQKTSGGSSSKSSSGEVPSWFTDLESAYPDKDYLAVIGEGDTRRDAESDAAGALSRIFRSEIKVDSTSVMRYHELDKGAGATSESEKDITKEVAIGSEQVLFNVSYSDTYTDKNGRVHVVGFLDRKETAKIYKEKIQKNGELIASFVKQMGHSESIITKYAFIDAAVIFAKNNEILLEQLLIIYPPTRKMIKLPYSLENLNKIYTQIAAQMVFTINVSNDSENKISDVVASTLSEKGFVISEGAAPLSVTGEVSIEETIMDNPYENVRWYLTLEMKDEKGNILVSFTKNQRESAISKTEAAARSYQEMEKKINKDFIGEFVKYLDSIVLK